MKSNTFFALMTGLAAGALLGVLFAPESGENSRKKLKNSVKSRLDELEEFINEEADEDGEQEEDANE